MGMTKTSVIRMLSAATKATNVDSNIMLGCMIVFRAWKVSTSDADNEQID